MNINDSFHVAWANLRFDRSRAIFSMLGIIVATGSVILVMSIVNGTRMAALDQLRLGKENMLLLRTLYDEKTMREGRLSMEDVEQIKNLPSVLTAFPDVIEEASARGSFGDAQLIFYGVDEFYPSLYGHQLLQGRFITKADLDERAKVCVLSDKIAFKLFGYDYPIGQRVRLNLGSLEVVGVYKEEERLRRMEQRGDMQIPLSTAVQLLKRPAIFIVQIRARPGQIDQAKKEVTEALGLYAGGRTGIGFNDIREYFRETEEWARRWMIQMALIAGISLFVGGVGLMNVMFASVAKRTQEIGVRKALGADSKSILAQFLIESVILAGLGGLIGALVGIISAASVEVFSQGKIAVSILPVSILLASVFSFLTGIFFGLFPASKAARLSPVEALRYE